MTTAAARAPTRRLWPLLPPLATGVFLLAVGAVIAASGETFGFDFRAYHRAAERVLAGERLYDTTVVETGGFGLFYYPPPFVLPLLPLGVIDGSIATLVWLAAQLVAFAAAIAIMPVGRNVRWGVVLLAGLMWPVAYSFKLGQVGPLLMLLFAVGWRSMGDPVRLGASAAGGDIIKLPPGLILVWAAVTGRWGAVAVGVAVGVAASAIATVVVGVGAWSDYAQLLSRVGDPIRTPHNFTPGAIAYQLGASAASAAGVQIVSAVMVFVALLVAIRSATAEASFLVAMVASQLLSPVLWDHYAILLLLPVAWLLERRHWWASLVPLAVSIVAVPITPPATYPLLFAVVLGAMLVIGMREHSDAVTAAAAAG